MQKQININDKGYWEIFHKVFTNWTKLVEQSIETKVSVADIIANKYDTSYAVGSDVANSIALSKAIG